MKRRARRRRRFALWTLVGIAGLVVVAALFVLAVNLLMVHDARSFIVTGPGAAPSAPVAIVLGAAFYTGGTPSPMMADRMDSALLLYRQGKVKTLLLTGDSRTGHDQVSLMLSYMLAKGVPKKDLLADGAGYTTYYSMLRAKTVFHVQSALIPTQRYHLARAVYLARSLGIDAIGVPAEIRHYSTMGETVREWGARVKAFLQIRF
ncbi:MAG TPA: ElyC/SanA/YdcF family protein [Thermoleophilia bacterium]